MLHNCTSPLDVVSGYTQDIKKERKKKERKKETKLNVQRWRTADKQDYIWLLWAPWISSLHGLGFRLGIIIIIIIMKDLVWIEIWK